MWTHHQWGEGPVEFIAIRNPQYTITDPFIHVFGMYLATVEFKIDAEFPKGQYVTSIYSGK